MKLRKFALILALTVTSAGAWAKLPPPSEEAKANLTAMKGDLRPAHPGDEISRDTVLTTHSDIRCRLRIMSSDEREDTARAGEVVSDYVLYIPFSYLPAKLRDNKKATSFRVVNIRTLYGLPEDAGPFDIQSVKLMAGEHHHYQVRLRKVN